VTASSDATGASSERASRRAPVSARVPSEVSQAESAHIAQQEIASVRRIEAGCGEGALDVEGCPMDKDGYL
jgi:hypothetical protein